MNNSPIQGAKSFECPHCGVLSQQTWFGLDIASRVLTNLIQHLYLDYRQRIEGYKQEAISSFLELLKGQLPNEARHFIPANFSVASCESCADISLWVGRNMVYPAATAVDPPNVDLNEEIQDLYAEAASICSASPKGAAALLRLALQKLMVQIGKDGKNINADIKELVAGGLSAKIQQALDLLRVVGNNAVHPGEISFDDNEDVALRMFRILNVIADELITKPREIDQLYKELIPTETQDHIQTRDGKQRDT